MARFQYPLQSILNIKQKMETQKKQEFAAAQIRVNECAGRVEKIRIKIAECDAKAKELLNGPLDLLLIQENKALQISLDNKLNAACQELSKAERELEKAKEEMAEARMERKTYETLRDQAFDEFLKEENKEEGRVVDELVSYTFGQRKKG